MNSLNNLGTALTVVFALCLLGLISELVYVLWKRKRFRRRSANVGGIADPEVQGDGDSFHVPSKELLYFFCWKKNQSRVEPAAAPTGLTDLVREAEAADDDNLSKWHMLFGPSRILYTIKEEDREGAESTCELSAESEAKSMRVSLRDAFEVTVLNEEAAEDVGDQVEEVTPFSTPCASPPYYTPSPSPGRDGSTILTPATHASSPASGVSV